MSQTVFIAEVEDSEYTGEDLDHFLTGRFYGHVDAGHRITDSFEDLSLDEALAWARERADRIVVRVGYGPAYAIGFESESRQPWPSERLPQPVRRRTPDEEWKDRTDEIDITVRAPTASRAREAALARVPPVPDGWRVTANVRFEGS